MEDRITVTQEPKGVTPEGTAPVPPPEGNPPSGPDKDGIYHLNQEALDKRVHQEDSRVGRENKELKDRLALQGTEMAGLRTAQEGIRTTQRQSQLDAAKDDPDATARLKAQFTLEDGKDALDRRSNDIDAKERQIAANAAANSDIAAQAKASTLQAATGVDAQALLDSPLVKDTAADGTVTYNLERMEALAITLKPNVEVKGVVPKGGGPQAAGFQSDAQIKANYAENPYNPVAFKAYMELRERSKV